MWVTLSVTFDLYQVLCLHLVHIFLGLSTFWLTSKYLVTLTCTLWPRFTAFWACRFTYKSFPQLYRLFHICKSNYCSILYKCKLTYELFLDSQNYLEHWKNWLSLIPVFNSHSRCRQYCYWKLTWIARALIRSKVGFYWKASTWFNFQRGFLDQLVIGPAGNASNNREKFASVTWTRRDFKDSVMNNIKEKLTGSLYTLINGMLRLQNMKFLCLKVVFCV